MRIKDTFTALTLHQGPSQWVSGNEPGRTVEAPGLNGVALTLDTAQRGVEILSLFGGLGEDVRMSLEETDGDSRVQGLKSHVETLA